MIVKLIIFVVALKASGSSVIYSTSETAKFLSQNEKNWWQTATFYQIYIRSFKDSNDDGIGDIIGVIEKLDYIKSLGVQAIMLSSFYDSKNVDFGYDITDHTSINSEYGTATDFITLCEEAHKRDIKVIIDIIPNHTSKNHQWFVLSQTGAADYKDYYIWADGMTLEDGGTAPPNNWVSVFKGSAWTWSPKRNQYYLHTFLEEEPDLNYRHKSVKEQIKKVLTFWLVNYQIDGIRITGASYLVEDINLINEPLSNINDTTPDDYEYLDHIYTKNQPESFEVVYEWREYIDEIVKSINHSRIIIVESDDPRFCKNESDNILGAHFNLNSDFLSLSDSSTAADLEYFITKWIRYPPEYFVSTWMLGNQDTHRIASRVDNYSIDGLNMLISFLPGIQISYNGEEIGMFDGQIDCTTQGQDQIKNCSNYESVSRDLERTPFQWNNTANGGFSDNTSTWLPVNEDYLDSNVVDEETIPKSHLNMFIQLQYFRANLSNFDGMYVEVLNDSNTLLVVRYKNSSDESDYEQYNFVFNFNSNKSNDIFMDSSLNFPQYKVVFSSINSNKQIGDIIYPEKLSMQPYEALILTPLPIDDNSRGSTNLSTGCIKFFLVFVIIKTLINL